MNNNNVNTEFSSHEEMKKFINNSVSLRPSDVIISDIKWKYLIRNTLRGHNILLTGPAGSGKTVTAFSLPNVLNRPFFKFNLGQTQDPKSYLIGNTHASNEKGTYFDESLFVKAIRTPNAIILLDEISRSHPDAWNILMPVLDLKQRYLRLDEAGNGEIDDIPVANGVSFISTANIGAEYTSTRIIDKALLDRFSIIEVDVLSQEQEFKLLKLRFPNVNESILKTISKAAHDSRLEVCKPASELSTMISTRMSIETADLVNDGFSLTEAADIAIYPFFDVDTEERTLIKTLVQKYMTIDDTTSEEANDLFTEEDFLTASL